MTHIQVTSHQASGLSAEADVFVPRVHNHLEQMGPAPLEPGGGMYQVPGYITSCYPFVQDDRSRSMQRFPGGRGSRPYMSSHMPGSHAGGARMVAPFKRGMGRAYKSYQPRTGHIATPLGPLVPNVVTQFQSPVPGMPFDGGTIPAFPGVFPHMTLVRAESPCFNQELHDTTCRYNWKITDKQERKLRTERSRSSQRKRHGSSPGKSSIGIQNEPPRKGEWQSRPRTIIFMDVAVQTEFNEEISNLTLLDRPHPLFRNTPTHHKKRRQRVSEYGVVYDSTDSNEDSDSGYSSPLHRQNLVSSGTHPAIFSSFEIRPHNMLLVVSNPQFSYSPMVRGFPSHPSINGSTNMSSICDSQETMESVTIESSCSNSHRTESELQSPIKYGNFEDISSTLQETISSNKDLGKAAPNADTSKKRRKKRSRKKSSGDEDKVCDNSLGMIKAISSSNVSQSSYGALDADNILHFEDDDEFPGLLKSLNDNQQKTAQVMSMSYSDILKSAGHSSHSGGNNSSSMFGNISSQTVITTDATPQEAELPIIRESRSARKRRKRREMANKAAEDELAEITLEQQMLKHLQKKPPPASTSTTENVSKTPVTDKDPVQEPGILTVPNPQTSGKKSKQPLTLDFAAMLDALEKKESTPEPSHQVKPKKIEDKQKPIQHNPLDSSAPGVKRGKERENPKPKKPSPLKKVILKEREEKKRLRLLEGTDLPVDTTDHDIDTASIGVVIESDPVGIGVVSESDLSQDATSCKSVDSTPASAELSPISQTSPISMSPLSPGPSPMGSGVNSPITGAYRDSPAAQKIHSRRFREYCNQVLDKDIDASCTALLQDLVRFQDRIYHKDPIKAKSRRRIVLGLREVTKHLRLQRIKCVIISPNLEKIQSKGGLDDALNNILDLCQEQEVPFVFALGRRALGRACAKVVPVSVVGVFNYEGSEENFKNLIELSKSAHQAYKEMVKEIEKEILDLHIPTSSTITVIPHLFAHMGHSRTPSGCSVISFTSSILSEPISENYPHSEPETDSKGYEIVLKNGAKSSSTSQSTERIGHVGDESKHAEKILDIDDGNEADTEDFNDLPRRSGSFGSVVRIDTEMFDNGGEEIDDSDNCSQLLNTVQDLPHIDSIHNYDPNAEILSQHSSRTLDNCEAMSTHSSKTTYSSKTLGDGSCTIIADFHGSEHQKYDITKTGESPSNTLQRGKNLDQDRIHSWVQESQNCFEHLEIDTSHDSTSSSDEEQNDCVPLHR